MTTKEDLQQKIEHLNSINANQNWLDMEVLDWKKNNLTVAGSIDFSYGHNLEITFIDVFHITINTEFTIDPSNNTLDLVKGKEQRSINEKYRVEIGNFIFKMLPDDFGTPFYIIAKDLEYNKDMVLYYKKENLEDGERIADWVT